MTALQHVQIVCLYSQLTGKLCSLHVHRCMRHAATAKHAEMKPSCYAALWGSRSMSPASASHADLYLSHTLSYWIMLQDANMPDVPVIVLQ